MSFFIIISPIVELMSQKISSAPTNKPGVFNYEEKHPSSEPKTGVAQMESKTPLFGNPAASQAGPWLYVPGSPQVCPFEEVVLL
jgi:hypothetical protein